MIQLRECRVVMAVVALLLGLLNRRGRRVALQRHGAVFGRHLAHRQRGVDPLVGVRPLQRPVDIDLLRSGECDDDCHQPAQQRIGHLDGLVLAAIGA